MTTRSHRWSSYDIRGNACVTYLDIFNVTIFIIVYYFELNTYKVPQYVFELFIYVEGRLGLREFNHYVILITFNVTIFPERIMLIMIYLI